MTVAEVVEYERRAAEREDGRPPDDPRTEQSVHPSWWLDYGKTVVKTARTSLIVDGRPHNSPNIRQWMGDSRGRWERETLVVDTVNFTDKTSFRGSGANLHVVERFTRIDADTLEYRFTVDDPSTWTRPWTVAYPMVKTIGQIYEYACHEGNYGLRDILSGARMEEREGKIKN
ncbi:MAG: hypothetical protein HY047_07785 [Acidobacteria bacterium]|nr:hypothetical protein [Acidobacteriota bacterium]